MNGAQTLDYLELREHRLKQLRLRQALASISRPIPTHPLALASTSLLAIASSIRPYPFPKDWVGFLEFMTGVSAHVCV